MLWARYCPSKNLLPGVVAIILQGYFDDYGDQAPRDNRVSAAMEACAKGGDRIMLVMGSRHGQDPYRVLFFWRLRTLGRKNRIVLLGDCNLLVNQTMVNDFRPLGAAMSKLSTKAKTDTHEHASSTIEGERHIDIAYEGYLTRCRKRRWGLLDSVSLQGTLT